MFHSSAVLICLYVLQPVTKKTGEDQNDTVEEHPGVQSSNSGIASNAEVTLAANHKLHASVTQSLLYASARVNSTTFVLLLVAVTLAPFNICTCNHRQG